MFQLLALDNGFVQVCGHRGHSIGSPENTLAALTATRDNGGTSAEIDVMLTADSEIVLMHDHFLDRTTNGKGLVSKATLEEVRGLDAGSWFDPKFAGERVPTLTEAIRHAREIGIGLVVEIKEFLSLPKLFDRLEEVIDETNGNEVAIFISFDHVVLKRLKERIPAVQTEGIVHAHHADIVRVAEAADLDCVAIDYDMFRAEDGKALHEAGVAIRVHLERPTIYERYLAGGVDLLENARTSLAEGHIDTISGDDVRYLVELVEDSREKHPRVRASIA